VAGVRRDPTGWLAMLIGARTRFIVGAVLLAGFLLWLRQNDLMRVDQMWAWVKLAFGDPHDAPRTTPLNFMLIPLPAMRPFFNSFAPGLAGVALVVSALWRSRLMGVMMMLAAAVIMLGGFVAEAAGVGNLGPLDPHRASMIVGGLIALAAFVVARK
jgi:hypothetical protein